MLDAGVHPEALPIISQQLATLETGRVTWSGQLWPGQNLHWEISRDEAEPHSGSGKDAAPGSDAPEPTWRTRIALHLPQLGAVSASIALSGNSVSVHLKAASPASQGRLGAAGPALAGALAAAGLSMHALGVDHAPAP